MTNGSIARRNFNVSPMGTLLVPSTPFSHPVGTWMVHNSHLISRTKLELTSAALLSLVKARGKKKERKSFYGK